MHKRFFNKFWNDDLLQLMAVRLRETAKGIEKSGICSRSAVAPVIVSISAMTKSGVTGSVFSKKDGDALTFKVG